MTTDGIAAARFASVTEWLHSLSLAQYVDAFDLHEIGLDTVSELTNEMLRDELGITPLGHRNKILKSIRECFLR